MDLPRTTEGKKFNVRVADLGREAPRYLGNRSLIAASLSKRNRKLILKLEKFLPTPNDNVHGASSTPESTQRTGDNRVEDGGSAPGVPGGVKGRHVEPKVEAFLIWMEVDIHKIRKLGLCALLLKGAGKFASKKYVLQFEKISHCEQAVDLIQSMRAEQLGQFLSFEHCGFLFNHKIFMKDFKRLRVYREAMQHNFWGDFYKKVVLDVGCGLGILSIFAARAGARKVYAVDPANVAVLAGLVVGENNFDNIIEIHRARVESVELPELVDTIVCDCFGEMLLNGQMLKSFLIARQRFLKPKGRIYPAIGKLRLRPFNDSSFEAEILRENIIWTQTRPGQGLFSAGLFEKALKRRYYRPNVSPHGDDPKFATCHEQVLDFASLTPDKLQRIAFPFVCCTLQMGFITGFTFSFGVEFIGDNSRFSLDSGFATESTRWHNVSCLVPNKVPVGAAEEVRGNCQLLANESHSYDIEIEFKVQAKSYKYKYCLEYGSAMVRNV